MRERVGECAACGKEIYCDHGFLQGVIGEEGRLHCFECADRTDGDEAHTEA